MSFRRVLSPAFQIWARKYCPPYPLQTNFTHLGTSLHSTELVPVLVRT